MKLTLSAMLPHFPCHPYFSAPICLHLLISTFALRKNFGVFVLFEKAPEYLWELSGIELWESEREKERKEDDEEGLGFSKKE